MKNNRRNFLKKTSLIGLGLFGGGSLIGSRRFGEQELFQQSRRQHFNMYGYAAPALDVVRIGVIGLGNRGSGTVVRLASLEGVEIRALCDLEPDRVKRAAESIRHLNHRPNSYAGGEEEWKNLCEREDIDLVAIATPWHLHTEQCVFSMEHDKHVYVELPAAKTIDECWKLVETSERTRKHCVQDSSSCISGIQAVMLNMVRQEFFGNIIHGEGAYIHDLLREFNFTKDTYHNLWRLNENIDRNGNLYPQHGLIPIMQVMDINCGDKMEYMVSMSSADFLMGPAAEELAATDDFWEPYVGRNYRGNMNTSIIKTHRRRTIMLQHDVSSTRPYTRICLISGTKGIMRKWPKPDRIATSHDGWLPEKEFNELVEKYKPEINKRFEELLTQAEQVRRAGRSYERVHAMDWRLIDCLRNGLPVEMNVYDAALSSSIAPLSEWSVANRSNPVQIPDFTNGAWSTNKHGMDIELKNGGGFTKIL